MSIDYCFLHLKSLDQIESLGEYCVSYPYLPWVSQHLPNFCTHFKQQIWSWSESLKHSNHILRSVIIHLTISNVWLVEGWSHDWLTYIWEEGRKEGVRMQEASQIVMAPFLLPSFNRVLEDHTYVIFEKNTKRLKFWSVIRVHDNQNLDWDLSQ